MTCSTLCSQDMKQMRAWQSLQICIYTRNAHGHSQLCAVCTGHGKACQLAISSDWSANDACA